MELAKLIVDLNAPKVTTHSENRDSREPQASHKQNQQHKLKHKVSVNVEPPALETISKQRNRPDMKQYIRDRKRKEHAREMQAQREKQEMQKKMELELAKLESVRKSQRIMAERRKMLKLTDGKAEISKTDNVFNKPLPALVVSEPQYVMAADVLSVAADNLGQGTSYHGNPGMQKKDENTGLHIAYQKFASARSDCIERASAAIPITNLENDTLLKAGATLSAEKYQITELKELKGKVSTHPVSSSTTSTTPPQLQLPPRLPLLRTYSPIVLDLPGIIYPETLLNAKSSAFSSIPTIPNIRTFTPLSLDLPADVLDMIAQNKYLQIAGSSSGGIVVETVTSEANDSMHRLPTTALQDAGNALKSSAAQDESLKQQAVTGNKMAAELNINAPLSASSNQKSGTEPPFDHISSLTSCQQLSNTNQTITNPPQLATFPLLQHIPYADNYTNIAAVQQPNSYAFAASVEPVLYQFEPIITRKMEFMPFDATTIKNATPMQPKLDDGLNLKIDAVEAATAQPEQEKVEPAIKSRLDHLVNQMALLKKRIEEKHQQLVEDATDSASTTSAIQTGHVGPTDRLVPQPTAGPEKVVSKLHETVIQSATSSAPSSKPSFQKGAIGAIDESQRLVQKSVSDLHFHSDPITSSNLLLKLEKQVIKPGMTLPAFNQLKDNLKKQENAANTIKSFFKRYARPNRRLRASDKARKKSPKRPRFKDIEKQMVDEESLIVEYLPAIPARKKDDPMNIIKILSRKLEAMNASPHDKDVKTSPKDEYKSSSNKLSNSDSSKDAAPAPTAPKPAGQPIYSVHQPVENKSAPLPVAQKVENSDTSSVEEDIISTVSSVKSRATNTRSPILHLSGRDAISEYSETFEEFSELDISERKSPVIMEKEADVQSQHVESPKRPVSHTHQYSYPQYTQNQYQEGKAKYMGAQRLTPASLSRK